MIRAFKVTVTPSAEVLSEHKGSKREELRQWCEETARLLEQEAEERLQNLMIYGTTDPGDINQESQYEGD